MAKGREVKRKHKLLWVGDAGCDTGFGRVSHAILDRLHASGLWDIDVMALNYFGTPNEYPYRLWPASLDGTSHGIKYVNTVARRVQPDVICILNDPWIVRDYIESLQKVITTKVAYIPIDGLNISNNYVGPLNQLAAGVSYTNFGLQQLMNAGFTGEGYAVPHGIDDNVFHQIGKKEARKRILGNFPGVDDLFIVGAVNRNQPRKRLDLTIQYFSEWVKGKPDNIKLYYHGAVDDVGWNIGQLCEYYGVFDRLIITDPNLDTFVGVPADTLNDIYNCFDLQLSTTLGEGWGLTTMEGMKCGIPQIVPDWSGLGEWARGGVHYVPCTSTQANPRINTIGGVADRDKYIEALEAMYTNEGYRSLVAKRGKLLVDQDKYKWEGIAQSFHDIFLKAMETQIVKSKEIIKKQTDQKMLQDEVNELIDTYLKSKQSATPELYTTIKSLVEKASDENSTTDPAVPERLDSRTHDNAGA